MNIKNTRRGFTLIELLVVVLIIGVLAAIALPMYQKAVLKSRFAALMPIVKSMNDSNEAYYLEHNAYASNPEELPVQGQEEYPTGTELEFGSTTDYAYVLATNSSLNNNYIMYQKHSDNYPGEIHCEADAEDTQAQEVCKSFGPTEDIGETLTSGYLTYVLSGLGDGVAPSGDGGGTSTAPALDPATLAKLQDVAAEQCPEGSTAECVIYNGKVFKCDGYFAKSGPEGCIPDEDKLSAWFSKNPNSTGLIINDGDVYDSDGNQIQANNCKVSPSYPGQCYRMEIFDYAPPAFSYLNHTEKIRECSPDVAISREGVCPDNYYVNGKDYTNSSGKKTSEYSCPANSDCSTYETMYEWNYDNGTKTRTCNKIVGHECEEWSQNW